MPDGVAIRLTLPLVRPVSSAGVASLWPGRPMSRRRPAMSGRELAADPARTRPAMAEAVLDVNGKMVRAQVAAHELHEVVDLLQRRLRDKIEHKADHLERCAATARWTATSRSWPPSNAQTRRPSTWTNSTTTSTCSDLATGQEGLLERLPAGGYRVQHLHAMPAPPPPSLSACEFTEGPRPAAT
jgi:hypothetical protein